jgi:RNA polymerase sigma-70 factor, ECF subfamily
MVFDFEKLTAHTASRQMAPQRAEDVQRDVYESHRHRVFSISYYMTGSELEAEELLRDTFIDAFRRAPEPDQTTVDNALVDQLNSRGLVEEAEFVPVPVTGQLPGGRNILRADLEEAIRCLPSQERLVFLLMDVEGYNAPRIADLLRLSPSEVVRAAVVARMRLRNELANLHEDDCQAA